MRQALQPPSLARERSLILPLPLRFEADPGRRCPPFPSAPVSNMVVTPDLKSQTRTRLGAYFAYVRLSADINPIQSAGSRRNAAGFPLCCVLFLFHHVFASFGLLRTRCVLSLSYIMFNFCISFATLLFLSPLVSAAGFESCYLPAGEQATNPQWETCSDDPNDPLSRICCATNRTLASGSQGSGAAVADKCLSNGLCLNYYQDDAGTFHSDYTRAYCTDPDFNSGNCLDICGKDVSVPHREAS